MYVHTYVVNHVQECCAECHCIHSIGPGVGGRGGGVFPQSKIRGGLAPQTGSHSTIVYNTSYVAIGSSQANE